jgi:hypothetical protein
VPKTQTPRIYRFPNTGRLQWWSAVEPARIWEGALPSPFDDMVRELQQVCGPQTTLAARANPEGYTGLLRAILKAWQAQGLVAFGMTVMETGARLTLVWDQFQQQWRHRVALPFA